MGGSLVLQYLVRNMDINKGGQRISISINHTKMKPNYLLYRCFRLALVTSFEAKIWAVVICNSICSEMQMEPQCGCHVHKAARLNGS